MSTCSLYSVEKIRNFKYAEKMQKTLLFGHYFLLSSTFIACWRLSVCLTSFVLLVKYGGFLLACCIQKFTNMAVSTSNLTCRFIMQQKSQQIDLTATTEWAKEKIVMDES